MHATRSWLRVAEAMRGSLATTCPFARCARPDTAGTHPLLCPPTNTAIMAVIKRKRYSRDLRQRVVHQRFKLHRQTAQISADLDMSLRVVERILHLWREIGDVCRVPKRIGRARALSSEHAEVCNMHSTVMGLIPDSLCWQWLNGTQTSTSTRSKKSCMISTGSPPASAPFGGLSSSWD